MKYEMKIKGKFPKGDYKEGMSGLEYIRSSFDKFKHWGDRYLCQEKIDGWHGIILKGSGRAYWSQGWEEYSALQEFLRKIDNFLPTFTIICGEMEYGTQKAIENTRKRGHPIFTAFDLGMWDHLDLEKEDTESRYTLLERVFDSLAPYIEIASTIILNGSKEENKERAWEMFNRVLNKGGEGIVLKKSSSLRIVGGESKEQYKIKRYVTKDYVCMGFESYNTAPTYTAKGINVSNMLCGLYNPKKKAIVQITKTSGFGDYWRREFTYNPKKYIGKVVELGGFEVFKSGAMRHSQFLRFREDRRVEECV
jgi:ATP-dependent DNA ligase